jgi:hypothetical protein
MKFITFTLLGTSVFLASSGGNGALIASAAFVVVGLVWECVS